MPPKPTKLRNCGPPFTTPKPTNKFYFFYGHRNPSQNRPTVRGGLFSDRQTLHPNPSQPKPTTKPFNIKNWDPHFLSNPHTLLMAFWNCRWLRPHSTSDLNEVQEYNMLPWWLWKTSAANKNHLRDIKFALSLQTLTRIHAPLHVRIRKWCIHILKPRPRVKKNFMDDAPLLKSFPIEDNIVPIISKDTCYMPQQINLHISCTISCFHTITHVANSAF